MAMILAVWLFAFFRDNGQSGVYFAVSEDGYQWRELKGGAAWIKPEQPGELMRDPFLARGPDGTIHLVWTWEWRARKLGYASSADLVTWSKHREVAVSLPGALNVWAPEAVWDEKAREWTVTWSSSVQHYGDHRIYAMTSRDFESFSEPRLFFDPGYTAIDATLARVDGHWRMVFKDEREKPAVMKRMKWTEAVSLRGPWAPEAAPITGEWTEGPSVVRLGRDWLVFFDHYRKPQYYGAVRTRDWKKWEDVSARVKIPAGARHGSFLELKAAEWKRLKREAER